MIEPRYMLDTNIVIYLRHKRHAKVISRFAQLAVGTAVMSIVTLGELYFGVAKSERPKASLEAMQPLFARIPPLAMSFDVARRYASLRAVLEARGQAIGSNDLWIAAHALSEELTLVTNNEREFRRIPGLNVENWVSA